MFFTNFATESADIIHEAQPSDETVEIMRDLYNNYDLNKDIRNTIGGGK